MASAMMMAITVLSSDIQPLHFSKISVKRNSQNVLKCLATSSSNFHFNHHDFFGRQLSLPFRNPQKGSSKFLFKPLANSGLEASITDSKESSITLKKAKIVIESQDENAMRVRVDLAGDETQKVFDHVLSNLARSAPPIPGFRRQKGGKTSNVPTSFLLDILGKERVTKFVIQEIVSSTMADYAKQENLNVKDGKINTTQSVEELKQIFSPGSEFGFNAVIELESSSTAESLS